MQRRSTALAVVGIVVVSAAGGWIVGSRIASPAEVAAQTASPQASPILVPVESKVLSSDVITRGTARFGSPQQVIIAPSALKASLGIIAGVPLPNTELVEGDVILTASDRPLFVLVGEQPVYRDLGPGLEGDDVRQLEEALGRLGFDPGPADGIYDDATEAAVTRWYESAGFTPFEATEAQLATIRAIEQQLRAARLEPLNAQDMVSKAELDLRTAESRRSLAQSSQSSLTASVESARAEAATATQRATADVEAKQRVVDELTGVVPPTPTSAEEIAIAEANLAAAQANAESVARTGQIAVDAAQANLNAVLVFPGSTPEAIARAQANLASVQAAAAAANTAATADVLAKARALDIARGLLPPKVATPSEIAAAQADLTTAKATLTSTRLAGQKAIADAELALRASSSDIAVFDAQIKAARKTIDIGHQTATERSAMVDLIDQDLDVALRRAGVQVPADEIVFLRSDSVRVSEVSLVRGSELAGSLMTVTDDMVFIDGSLPVDVAGLIQPGQTVSIDEAALGIQASGIVERVASAPGTNGVDGFHVYFATLVEQAPANLVGSSVRLTVPVESTASDVLAVPIAALSLSADGSSIVQRQVDGVLEAVKVEPGLAADGFVEVRPLSGDLKAGDLVLVGFEQRATQGAVG